LFSRTSIRQMCCTVRLVPQYHFECVTNISFQIPSSLSISLPYNSILFKNQYVSFLEIKCDKNKKTLDVNPSVRCMPKETTSKSDNAWPGLSTLVHLRYDILKASLTIVFSYNYSIRLIIWLEPSVAIDFLKPFES